MSALHIWMNGELVGTWRVGRTGNHRLDYAPSWRASARSRPLSLSLPFTFNNQLEGDAVRNYFDNLLPDSDGIRKRLGARFQTKSTDAFALLQAVGRDGSVASARQVVSTAGRHAHHPHTQAAYWSDPWAQSGPAPVCGKRMALQSDCAGARVAGRPMRYPGLWRAAGVGG